MQTLQPTNTIKRVINIITINTRVKKTKKVGDILKNLGFDKIGTGKSNLSIKHDNILYK